MKRYSPLVSTLAIFLLCATDPLLAQLQGTLFTSAEQRAYLDALRAEHLARSRERGFDINDNPPPLPPPREAEAPASPPRIYSLEGIMSRRDGSYSIWLNGRSLTESELPTTARLSTDNGSLGLRFITPLGNVFLKPGQVLNFDAGQVQESYQATDAAAASGAPDEAGD